MNHHFNKGLLLTSFGMSIGFFGMLGNADLSFIPVLCIVLFGISMSATAFMYFRYVAATKLLQDLPPISAVKKLLNNKIKEKKIKIE